MPVFLCADRQARSAVGVPDLPSFATAAVGRGLSLVPGAPEESLRHLDALAPGG